MKKEWQYFKEGKWTKEINVSDFIKKNYKQKLNSINPTPEDKSNLLGLFGTLSDFEKRDLINEVLTNTNLNLIVTPTEIDFLIAKLSNLIASSINNALHRQINHF